MSVTVLTVKVVSEKNEPFFAATALGDDDYAARVRWLYHLRIVSSDDAWPYLPTSFAKEQFIHASYRDAVRESAALYFAADAKIEILIIDPRKLTAKIDVATTPRGPMPHIRGAVERAAVTRIVALSDFDPKNFPDAVDD